MQQSNKLKKIFISTPTLTGGSWVVIEDLISLLKDKYKINVVGFGAGRLIDGVEMKFIPYFSFEKINPKLGRNIFYNFLYQFPLQLINLFLFIRTRPNLVLANGFTSIIAILPLAKLFRIPVVVYYGSYLTDWFKNSLVKKAVTFGGNFVDLVFVNSQGSLEDISAVIPVKKISVIEHWTNFEPVHQEERTMLRSKNNLSSNDLVILFVGRFTKEKGIETLLKTIPLCSNISNIYFWIVGDGLLLPQIKQISETDSHTKYLGFVKEREKLKELFTIADLTWTFADETYIAKPGIESLALGTPLLVPETAAITEKYNLGIKIRATLVPSEIGWIVSDSYFDKNAQLIKDLSENTDRVTSMRIACSTYAKEKYSQSNIANGVKVLESYVK